jgi:aspartyl-tRNA(Asn)/glutamyl-tRNA(Gln) amidotransferase subunit A
MNWSAISAAGLAEAVRGGEVPAREVTAAFVERIAERDPRIGAFLHREGDAAVAAAESIDRRRARGEALGPLAGVPIAVKDNLNWMGRPLTCGSRILGAHRAVYDATVIERLQAADAVLVGKTNLDEFAMGSSCENSAFHPTRNPWDLERVPGGSSGGSAAAVAAGMVPLALGSDTGGSVRQPAALCGVVGFKPTYGRVSRYGLVAFASSLDQVGPLARTVADAALAYSVIAGHDPRDATSAARPAELVASRLGEDPAADLSGRSFGIVAEVDTAVLPADARRLWQRTLSSLEERGARLVPVSVPDLPAAIALYYVLANCEASANLARFDGVRYGARAAAGDLAEMYVESRSQGFGAEVKRRIMLGTFALSSGYADQYHGRARRVLAELKQQLATALGLVDALLTPTSPTSAFRLGERVEDPLAMYLSDIFTVPANLAGLPALAVPMGLDDAGLPLSLQVIGRAFDDAGVLSLGGVLESTRDPDWARTRGAEPPWC